MFQITLLQSMQKKAEINRLLSAFNKCIKGRIRLFTLKYDQIFDNSISYVYMNCISENYCKNLMFRVHLILRIELKRIHQLYNQLRSSNLKTFFYL